MNVIRERTIAISMQVVKIISVVSDASVMQATEEMEYCALVRTLYMHPRII